MIWYVYLLRCRDNSLYCGCTNDLDNRVIAHNTLPTGAKYTRGRRPVRLVYFETHENRSEAQKRESAIKRMSRVQKEELIAKQT